MEHIGIAVCERGSHHPALTLPQPNPIADAGYGSARDVLAHELRDSR